jgi:hypothetical protein
MKLFRRTPWRIGVLSFGAVSLYFGFKLALWLLFRRVGVSVWPAQTQADLNAFRVLAVCIVAFAYGIWRATAFHPAIWKGYLTWLRTTPWRPGVKLPLGPVAFTWWDAIILGVGILFTLRLPLVTIFMLMACAAGYVFFAFMILREILPWSAYAIALAGAFLLRYALAFPWAELIVATMLVFAHAAMIWSLRGFPWEKDPSKQPPENIGWLSMIPPDCKPLVSIRVAVAACVMTACWIWAIISVVDVQSQLARADAVRLSLALALVPSLIRLGIYCNEYRSPISFSARLRSGRLVVPGYDSILLAPAAAPIAAGAISFGLDLIGAPAGLVMAGGLGTSLAVLLIAPPSFRNWQLAGFNRRLPFRRDSLARSQQRAQNKSMARLFAE